MSRPQFSTVPLHRIAAASRWDIHPFLGPEVPPGLNRSFVETGVLQPPLLLALDDGMFEIIDGRKRVQAARKTLNLSECPCLVVPATSLPREILSVLLASQSCHAPLSPMETAYFLKICGDFLPPEEVAKSFLLRLTGRDSISLLPRYNQLLTLELGLQSHVHHHFISEAMALELLQLTADDRCILLDLFADFQMGGGKQRRFFSLARDLAMRAETSITAILAQPPLQEILQHRQMNAPQKVQNLLTILQQMATPSLHRDEQSFKAAVARLDLPACCSVQHSQAFETEGVHLSITFDNFDQLRRSSAALLETLRDLGLSDT
jgi:hypothetical protein